MRPVGPDDGTVKPRQSDVGDGHKPSAGVRILKARGSEPGQAARGASPKAAPSLSSVAAARASAAASRPAGSPPVAARPLPWMATAAELCSTLRLPPDAASYATLSAMLGERMPLDARTASAIRRAVRRHEDDPAAARAAARATAAGLDPDDPAIERLLGALDSSGAGARGGTGGEADTGRRRDDKGDREELEALATSLRAATEAAMADGDFSAMAEPGPDGSGWACVPFSAPFGDVSFHGYMRIWYTSNGSTRRVGRFVADIRFGDERRLFELSMAGGRRTVAYYSDDAPERDAFEAEFGGADAVRTAALDLGYFSELVSRRSIDEDA